jgi:hypothetical protein
VYFFIFFWFGLLVAGAVENAWSWWWLWVWLYGLGAFAAGVAFGFHLLSRFIGGFRK